MTATEPRPRVVTIALVLLLVGAALLFLGGLSAASLSFDTVRTATAPSVSDEQIRGVLRLHRGAGVLCALAAVGLAFLTLRTGAGNARYCRATIGLGLALVVVVGLLAVFVGTNLFALVSLLPIIVGTLLLIRPATASWFAQDTRGEPDA